MGYAAVSDAPRGFPSPILPAHNRHQVEALLPTRPPTRGVPWSIPSWQHLLCCLLCVWFGGWCQQRTDRRRCRPQYEPPHGGPAITSREPRVNDRIRAREVRLVDPDGGRSASSRSKKPAGLPISLVSISSRSPPDARPPVVRMMDYGKYKYEQSVKAREARKKQTRTVIKEVQFRPKISSNDFDVKRKRVERFLGEGDKVKVTMRFRGREVTHPEIGREILAAARRRRRRPRQSSRRCPDSRAGR